LIKSLANWIEVNSALIGVILSFVGLLLSILGFYILWMQTRKIRSAAQAAASATEDALRAISDTDTISDLSSIRERFKKVQVALRSARFETALIEVQSLRESLHQLRNRRGFVTDESKIEIQEIVTFLRRLQTHFEKRMFDEAYQFPTPAANKALADHGAKVSEWLEKMRYLRGGDR
jgi:biopolymer transport protein ExbB/TolQ